MEVEIQSAVISALVSMTIVVLDRLVFVRSSRRFEVLKTIRYKLNCIKKDPPWSTNGGNIHFEKVRQVASKLDSDFEELYAVSFPWRKCHIQKAWREFRFIDEEKWRREHQNRPVNYDSLTADEFIDELDKLRIKLLR